MARENTVILHGQLSHMPNIKCDIEGNPTRAMFFLRVMRKPIGPKRINSNDIDCPLIITKDSELIKIVGNLKVGDMVDVYGTICTQPCIKSSICNKCGYKTSKEGTLIYVHPIYLCQRENLTLEEGEKVLRKRREVSNIVNVIGNVCSDIHHYEDRKGRQYTEYQLAVNRRFHSLDSKDDIDADFPWVKAYSEQAQKDAACLHLSSTVYIHGLLQTRKIERKCICEQCGQEYLTEEQATDLVPYYTGYLANCDIPEPQKE